MDIAFETFLAEADELLSSMESALLKINDGDRETETLNELFRGAHTIKGSAGLFGLDAVVAFTHDVENVIDRLRDGAIEFDSELINILFSCRDHILTLVTQASSGVIREEFVKTGEFLLSSLEPWKDKTTAPEKTDVKPLPTGNTPCQPGLWHISFRLNADALKNGMDPISIFRFLETLGQLEYIVVIDDDLPADDFDPELLYLGFEIGLYTDQDRNEIEDAFIFVRDDSDLHILEPNSSPQSYIKLIESTSNENKLLGEILLECGAITQTELEAALTQQAKNIEQYGSASKSKPIGEILVETTQVDGNVIEAALKSQSKSKKSATAPRFLRVEAQRLDTLINLIGELVINQQRVESLASFSQQPELQEATANLSDMMEQVQDAALTLRMIPIGETLQRFKRLVRDTSEELGKHINLELYGEETELDRSMVEKLIDPLTHIIRNAIDHGIESADERQQTQKPKTGSLTISAKHDAGNIVIEVSDDGRGLNTEKIRQKAIDKNLISSSLELSEAEVHQMIFHPGFSTADSVTNLSGRGVGMDVVRRNIEDLQGSIEIESTFTKGTCMRIRLPLTLAIIDGFHVSVSNTNFIIPQASVIECLDYDDTPRIPGGNKIDLRGDLVPFITLNQMMNLAPSISPRREFVVVQFGNERVGIVVDELHGELKTVVKPLNPIFSSLRGIGGSTLLGNGAIAFILDIPQLIHFIVARETITNQSTQGYAS